MKETAVYCPQATNHDHSLDNDFIKTNEARLLATGETPLSQDDAVMVRFDQESHSFVIRLWQERQARSNAAVVWRGWIKHVQSGRRHYFQNATALHQFVAAYLGEEADLTSLFSDMDVERES